MHSKFSALLFLFALFFSLIVGAEDIQVPAGCQKTESVTGIEQVNCDFSQSEQEFKEFSVKQQFEQCDGRFEMVNGAPVCIKEGTAGFNGIVCPAQAELDAAKANCEQKIETYSDPNGCSAVRCVNEEFAQKFEQKVEEKFSGVQADAILCEKTGGELVIVDNNPLCVGKPTQGLSIKENLSQMNEPEINATANKIEKIETLLESASQKLDSLENDANQQQNSELIDETKKTIESLKEKLDAAKTTLDVSIEMTPAQKVELISDLHSIKKELSQATFGIAKGEIITDAFELKKKFELYQEYYGRPFTKEQFEAGVEQEKSAQEKIRTCDSYQQGTSFVPPDPDGMVVNLELKPVNGKCEITLTTKMGKTAKYSVEKKDYSVFTGPETIVNSNSCQGEACDFIKQLVTQPHGTTPEQVCTEKCIVKDCSLGMYACMQKNLTRCEVECGLKKQNEGPYDSKGQFDPMQACVMMCTGDESMQCKPGGTNATCNACETKCIKAYGPGHDYEKCVTEEKLEAQKSECFAQDQYAEPVEEQVMEKTCITGVICRAYPEKTEDSGTGPDSAEPGHGIGEELGPLVATGGVTFYDGFIEFIARLVSGK